jgi:predicted short-subunit dehydrogenase-like oxidoreductase (DUF2520 family)
MRELDRTDIPRSCAIVGAGRLGTAMAAALRAAGMNIEGPLDRAGAAALHDPPAHRPHAQPIAATVHGPTADGRHEPPARAGSTAPRVEAVLLCVPDGEIAAAAEALAPGPLVGHCSGATGLAVLAPHEAFSLHPLMTVPAGGPPPFAGAGCAVAGSTDRAAAFANDLARRLGMRATTVADADRAAYHAAASIAANFVVTLEGAAERLAATAGVGRELLAPLVRAAVDNWARLGAAGALTGPIARGDEATVQRQRHAVAERAPDLLPLYDALTDATRALVPVA